MGKVHPRVPFEFRKALRDGKTHFSLRTTSRDKKVVFTVLVVVVFSVAVGMILRSSEKGAPVDPTAAQVRVSMSGFSPSTLTAGVGEPLKIDLINMDNQYHTDGGGWHNFVIEAFGIDRSVEPLGQIVFSLPAENPGTYAWYCDICCGGKENPSMRGTLIIEP